MSTPLAERPAHRPPTHPDVVVTETRLHAVKVWQPLVRVLHWSLVATIVVLSATGWYIANPLAVAPPAWDVMTLARGTHLVTAWVFVAVVLARVVLAFTGNPWARWDQFVPVSRRRRRELWHSVRYYAFLERHPAAVIGHNPLAGLAYLGLLGMLAGELVTGLALMSVQEAGTGWKGRLAGWLVRLATVAVLRLVHHLLIRSLRGDPGLQAGEESDPCGAGQG